MINDGENRMKFVDAMIKIVIRSQNHGFTCNAFFELLDDEQLFKSMKLLDNGIWVVDRGNDWVTTTQKAAQDFEILVYMADSRAQWRGTAARRSAPPTAYVDDATAERLGLSGRKPDSAVLHCASRRGIERRYKNKQVTDSHNNHLAVSAGNRLRRLPLPGGSEAPTLIIQAFH